MGKVKSKIVFICSNCGHNSAKWEGKCPSCSEWNTFKEEIIREGSRKPASSESWVSKNRSNPVQSLSSVTIEDLPRLPTGDSELDRVLGGGIVPGSIILVGGQPGIGKSTLLLQVALQIPHKTLYVSGEESAEQIRMRANRLGAIPEGCMITTETFLPKLLKDAIDTDPSFLIIDSIQTISTNTVESTAGSISQVRECAAELQRFSKETGIAVFLIGHITKDGNLAGPKVLEHVVDTVLQFEGDRHYVYRILRNMKNRFGSTDEMGIYQMGPGGLRIVENPSELLLSQREENLSGSAICATIEGQRPILVETQALVSQAVYGNPQRSATGFELRRMSMLLAVLEKRLGLQFGQNDVFLNVVGGIRIDDPAMDLSVIAALISSFSDIEIPQDVCFAAEVGLSGEVRRVNRIEQRIQEAARLGFKRIFISRFNQKGIDPARFDIQIHYISKITELYQSLFI
ncbi:MAG: DNA repair protein RadA [Saprospiraceae bacterium]|nr:DNA repair protein RadA [Saprospiraceae bacterium]